MKPWPWIKARLGLFHRKETRENFSEFFVQETQSATSDHCKICAAQAHALDKYFDMLFYEMVNDFEQRQIIRQAWGFCPRHVTQLATYGDPLGGSIIVDDVLNHLSEMSFPYEKPAPCPACDVEKEVIQRYTPLVIQLVRTGHEDISLCWSHFKELVTSTDISRDVRQKLWTAQQKRWKAWLEPLHKAAQADYLHPQDRDTLLVWRQVLAYWSDNALSPESSSISPRLDSSHETSP
ncbi:DUF6062 family protein [Sulfobacillus thermosulfidooxidans]|uniref:DUF6062 family protein n=1 Tax=Sulfobacillus thermosulfidooxidans TaxID=28034 RepID=UPI001111B179|nr:DUF6062 family protein [Sulfobacillus thermosulfidooxidans]